MNHPARLLLTAALSAGASAQPTLTLLPAGQAALDLSGDGLVVVGNTTMDGSYETFRWTAAGGLERLGRASVPVLGRGAGSPDVSLDGTRVSATILGANETYATAGVWTAGLGWEEIPQTFPSGGIMDASYASAWGLSGDGGTVCGLYWRPGQPGGSAHGFAWRIGSNPTPLASGPRSGRVNAANFDGSVLAGWTERTDGAWQPTVWRDGTMLVLAATDASTMCEQVSRDGSVVAGQSYNAATRTREAALWTWNGASYTQELLGVLPGTPQQVGQSNATGVTDDGGTVVGWNARAFPFVDATGFVWTRSGGMVSAEDFVAGLGLSLGGLVEINFTGVTPDGRTIIGLGIDPGTRLLQSFVIDRGPCSADCDTSTGVGTLDVFDFLCFQNRYALGSSYACDCDTSTGTGACDVFDFLCFQNAYDAGCR